MKILLPVDKNTAEARINETLGRSKYFLVRDTDSGQSEIVENPAAKSTGGAGIKAAQTIVDLGTDIVLAARCGSKAMDILRAAEIRVYKTESEDVDENIEAYLKGELKDLKEDIK